MQGGWRPLDREFFLDLTICGVAVDDAAEGGGADGGVPDDGGDAPEDGGDAAPEDGGDAPPDDGGDAPPDDGGDAPEEGGDGGGARRLS